MTNEEKAKELANKWSTDGAYNRAKISAMEMADWKDQQFKEYLEKKRERYYKKLKHNDIETLSKINELNEIINELFPKTENDDLENDE